MNFVKGVIVGSVISVGALMLYTDKGKNSKKIMKQGRKIIKNMGWM